jgi:hypothetical protein
MNMSANITIAAFVFGAILVLIGILGGKFRIFGAEVSGFLSNRFLRCAAFIIGAFFLISAMFSSETPRNKPVIEESGHSPLSPELIKEIPFKAIKIRVTDAKYSDGSIQLSLEVINEKPERQGIVLYAHPSYSFQRGSQLIINGNEYKADTITFGSDRGTEKIGKTLSSSGTLNAILSFSGIPPEIKTINMLELAYSVNNSYSPDGLLEFPQIALH